MPTTAAIPPQQAAAQARADRRVSRLLRGLDHSCDGVLRSRGVAKRAEEERKVLAEHHPEYAAADLRAVAVYWVMVFLPLAVWLVDVCLLSAVSEYLAILMFPDRPQLVLAVRLLVALAVVGVELGLATRLHHAHEMADETENRLPYLLCWAGALVWAAFLAACLVATQQAAGAEDEASTRTLMYALAGFSFLLHLLLPFSHELLYDAKGYLLFHLRDSRLRATERRGRLAENEARGATTATFQQYARELNRLPGSVAGPFSVAVRSVINEIFGEGTIPTPNRLGESDGIASAPPAPAPAPVTPANGNGAGATVPNPSTAAATPDAPAAENEYLRTILSRRQQDEESEVKP